MNSPQAQRCRCGRSIPVTSSRQCCPDCTREQNRKARESVKNRRAAGVMVPHEALLSGPYRPPKVKSGDWIFDELRGLVEVGGHTDALQPWPFRAGIGGRYPSLVLCAELARAVWQESELAVSYWWGVSVATVCNWRKALGVPRMTPGTTEAYRSVMLKKLPPEIVERGRAKLNAPETIAKMSKARKGQPAPQSVRDGLLRAAKAPKSETWKEKHTRNLQHQWNSGMRNKSPVWTDERIFELAKMKSEGKTDRECAVTLDVSLYAVRDARKRGKTDARFSILRNIDLRGHKGKRQKKSGSTTPSSQPL